METKHHRTAWYVINGITLYRIIAAPALLILLFAGKYEIFKWLLPVSFFTDLIDGFLARKYKVTSVLGTRLDSIGDDLTVLVGVIGLFYLEWGFIKEQRILFFILLALFIIQVSYAFARYGRMTNFHTYLAKLSALLQGVFLILTFLLGKPSLPLFYIAVFTTMLELLEEIILVYMLPKWQINIKGIYWVMKDK